MNPTYNQLFENLPTPEPSADLLNNITTAIHQRQKLAASKYKIFLLLLGVIGSLMALVPAWQLTKTTMTESGFIQFASLMFSDAKLMGIYWQSFLFSLLESIPIVGSLMLLAVTFVFFKSLTLLINNFKTIYHHSSKVIFN